MFFLYNSLLFSFLHFILCRICVCHMFNKVLTYLLTCLLIDLFAFLRPPLGDLGKTYDDHLRLIGKRVVNFLLVL